MELRQALVSTPNRFRGLADALKAAHADSPRPELDEARGLLKQ